MIHYGLIHRLRSQIPELCTDILSDSVSIRCIQALLCWPLCAPNGQRAGASFKVKILWGRLLLHSAFILLFTFLDIDIFWLMSSQAHTRLASYNSIAFRFVGGVKKVSRGSSQAVALIMYFAHKLYTYSDILWQYSTCQYCQYMINHKSVKITKIETLLWVFSISRVFMTYIVIMTHKLSHKES